MTDKTKERLIAIGARYWQGVILWGMATSLIRNRGMVVILLWAFLVLPVGLTLYLLIAGSRHYFRVYRKEQRQRQQSKFES